MTARNAYQVRLQRDLDQMARRTNERREEASTHGFAVMRRWEDAARGYFPEGTKLDIEHNTQTGLYRTSLHGNVSKWVQASTIDKATEWYYAATHAREIEVAEEN